MPSPQVEFASGTAATTRLHRLRAVLVDGCVVPQAFQRQQLALVHARIRALAPVIAALTLAWIPIDAVGLDRAELARILPLRLLLAAGLLLLARAGTRLSATAATAATRGSCGCRRWGSAQCSPSHHGHAGSWAPRIVGRPHRTAMHADAPWAATRKRRLPPMASVAGTPRGTRACLQAPNTSASSAAAVGFCGSHDIQAFIGDSSVGWQITVDARRIQRLGNIAPVLQGEFEIDHCVLLLAQLRPPKALTLRLEPGPAGAVAVAVAVAA